MHGELGWVKLLLSLWWLVPLLLVVGAVALVCWVRWRP